MLNIHIILCRYIVLFLWPNHRVLKCKQIFYAKQVHTIWQITMANFGSGNRFQVCKF